MVNNSAVLRSLTDMKKVYKDQNFTFSKEQQEKYDLLLELRRQRITQLREDGRIWVGPSEAGKVKEEEDWYTLEGKTLVRGDDKLSPTLLY